MYRSFILQPLSDTPLLPLAPGFLQLYRNSAFLFNWCTFIFTHSFDNPTSEGEVRALEKKKKTALP